MNDISDFVVQSLSCVRLFCDPMDCQDPLSMGFPRQKYWSGLPFPFPGDFPHPGIEPESPALAGAFFTTEPPFLRSEILQFGNANIIFKGHLTLDFPHGPVIENPSCNTGHMGSVPGGETEIPHAVGPACCSEDPAQSTNTANNKTKTSSTKY